jgi:hypothetical protein
MSEFSILITQDLYSRQRTAVVKVTAADLEAAYKQVFEQLDKDQKLDWSYTEESVAETTLQEEPTPAQREQQRAEHEAFLEAERSGAHVLTDEEEFFRELEAFTNNEEDHT